MAQCQRAQALWQKLVANVAANVATAPELRRQEFAETGRIQTKSPHPPTAFQTVVWTRYLTEKAARRGISLEWIDEASSTSTGRQSGRVRPAAPLSARGLWRAGCGARVHRDVNGGANSCSKAAYGRYSKVQADTIK